MEDRSVLNANGEDGWFRRLPVQTRLLLVLMGVMGSCHIVTGPPFYYSEPIRGRVIDEHTGMPNPGVVVVPIWVADGGWASAEPLYADEAVTDAEGEFVIPAMWPRLRRPMSLLCRNDPEIWLYKPGYHLSRLNNSPRHPYGYAGPCRFYALKRYSYWDGRTIPLRPASSVEDQAGALKTTLSLSMRGTGRTIWLHPRSFPHIWAAMVRGDSKVPPELTLNIAPLVERRAELLEAR